MSRERGSSLVSVMVGLAVVSAIAVIGAQFTSNQLKAIDTIKQQSDLVDLRDFVRIRMDCAKTKAAYAACASGGKVELLDKKGENIFANFSSKKYSLQPVCVKASTYQVNWRTQALGSWKPLFEVQIEC